MTAVGNIFILAMFGLLHLVTCQTGTLAAAPEGTKVMSEVTATVMALLNQTGNSLKPTDPTVQEIVGMLMNGTVPTEADLMRLNVISQPPTLQVTTPPPYSLPGRRPVFDPSITLTPIGPPVAAQTGSLSSGSSFLSLTGGTPTGVQTGVAPTAQTGSLSSGSSFLSLTGGAPTGVQTGLAPTAAQTGFVTGSTNPFASATSGNALPFFNLAASPEAPQATPKPQLGDPFSNTAMSGPALQNLALLNANALGPKPFASLDPIGGLGTPGSPTDLLGPGLGAGGLGAGGLGVGGMGAEGLGIGGMGTGGLGIGGMGTGGLGVGGMGAGGLGVGGMGAGDFGAGASYQTGFVNPGLQQRSPPRTSNPMMTMMMMNPELMETMMADNPMMAFMMMQQMNRPQPPPQPTVPILPSMPMDIGGMNGLGGAAGGASGGMMSLQPPMGGGAGGMMDLMGGGSGGSFGTQGMGGLGGQGLTGMDTLGAGASMGLNQGSLATGGAQSGLTDINSFLNMGSTGMAGPSAAPMMNPMLSTMG